MVSLWVAIKINHEHMEPQIIVYLELMEEKGIVKLNVWNLGKGVARNINFSKFDQNIFTSSYRKTFTRSFVNTGIPILAPNATRSTIVTDRSEMKDIEGKTFDIEVTYEKEGIIRKNIQVTERFTLDYISFMGSLHIDSDMRLIRKAIEKIEKDLNKLIDAGGV